MVFKEINDKLDKVCRELIRSRQNRAGSDYNDRMVRYQRSSAVEQRHYESSISGWLINSLRPLAERSASFSPRNGKFQRPIVLLSDFSIELTIHLLSAKREIEAERKETSDNKQQFSKDLGVPSPPPFACHTLMFHGR